MGEQQTPTAKCSAREIKFFPPLFGKKMETDACGIPDYLGN